MSEGHSILPPSGAKSWTVCTASVPYCVANADRIPEDRGSIYSAEGTQAHDYAQKILEGKMREEDLPEAFAPVLEYTSRCKALINRWGGSVFVEAKVSLFYHSLQNGTLDFALLCDQILVIRDLKYGSGVPVDAEENEQLAIYAQSLVQELSMLYDLHDDLVVEIGIIQPRYQGGDCEKIWTTTIGDLRRFCEPIMVAAESILEALADPARAAVLEFAPSEDRCRWCKAKAFCTARGAHAFEGVSVSTDLLAGFDVDDPENVHLPVMTTLSDLQILAVVRRGKDLRGFIDSCEKYLTERALTGAPLEGTKLVEGRQGNRTWIDETSAARLLAVDLNLPEKAVFDLKVKSPTKIMEFFKANKTSLSRADDVARVESLIMRSPGKPVLAFSEDPRPAIAPPTGGFLTDDENE